RLARRPAPCRSRGKSVSRVPRCARSSTGTSVAGSPHAAAAVWRASLRRPPGQRPLPAWRHRWMHRALQPTLGPLLDLLQGCRRPAAILRRYTGLERVALDRRNLRRVSSPVSFAAAPLLLDGAEIAG